MSVIVIKIFSLRNNNKVNKKSQKETIIDLEKDPETKVYKPKE